jgi:plasmid stability protein
MAILQVKSVTEEIYEALRARAHSNRRSIAAEVRILLAENFPTAAELKARRLFLRRISRVRASRPSVSRKFQSTEQMQRKDRSR